MKRRSNKELFVSGEPRSDPFLDDTPRFDPVTTFWTKRLRERERGLQAKNAERQCKAERDHQEYRDIARRLTAENPQLRLKRNRLAQKVRTELVKRGRVVSTRTIWEALGPKK